MFYILFLSFVSIVILLILENTPTVTSTTEILEQEKPTNSDSNLKRTNIRLRRNLHTLIYITAIENNSQLLDDSEHLADFYTIKRAVQERIINMSSAIISKEAV